MAKLGKYTRTHIVTAIRTENCNLRVSSHNAGLHGCMHGGQDAHDDVVHGDDDADDDVREKVPGTMKLKSVRRMLILG